jgi:hypothetical protein
MPQKTDYPNLRQNMHSAYSNLSDRRLEALLARNNIDAEAMEGFFDSLKSFAAGAGKSLLQAAPSILQTAGGIAGTFLGGPLGAQIGSSLGSLAGQAVGAATGQAPPAQTSAPTPAAAPGAGSPAAGQLLQTITNPATMQALASMAMGAVGKPDVSVGGTPVPVGAFANLLKTLSTQAEAETNAMTRSATLAYMQDFAGEAKADATVAQNRAAVLYEMLQTSEADEEAVEAEGVSEAEAAEAEALEAEYAELEEAYEEAYEESYEELYEEA